MALEDINKIAWGIRLLPTAVLVSFVNRISSYHILKAQHCSLGVLTCLWLPTCPHLLPPPPPAHPLYTQCVILQELIKTVQKSSSIQVACRNSYNYEIIAKQLHYLFKISGVTVLYHQRSTVHSNFNIMHS